jgi:hypothetical protein
MIDLESELTELLIHAKAIGEILKRTAKGDYASRVSIETNGGSHPEIPRLDNDKIVIIIRNDTMRAIQANSSTKNSTFNEINCKIHQNAGLTYGKWQYEDYYYQE